MYSWFVRWYFNEGFEYEVEACKAKFEEISNDIKSWIQLRKKKKKNLAFHESYNSFLHTVSKNCMEVMSFIFISSSKHRNVAACEDSLIFENINVLNSLTERM